MWSRGGRSRQSVAREPRGTRLAGERRLQGSWPARRAHSPLCPLPRGFRPGSERRDRRPQAGAGAGGLALPMRPLWVSPQVSGKVQAGRRARLFWLPRGPALAQLFPRCSGRGTPEPSGPSRSAGAGAAGAGHSRLWNAPSDHLHWPGRAPRLLDSFPEQNLRAAFGFFLSYPRGAGDTISLGDLLLTLLCPTIHTDTHTAQVSDAGGRTKEVEKTRYFRPVGEINLPVKKFRPARVGAPGDAELIAPSLLSCCPPSASLCPSPSPPPGTRREPRRVRGPRKQPSSPATPAALKSDPKEFRIRFQNTAEPSRTNTPRCRGRAGTHSGHGE